MDPWPADRMKRSLLIHWGSAGLYTSWGGTHHVSSMAAGRSRISTVREAPTPASVPKRMAPMSAQPRGRPKWPEWQEAMESMARPRASLATCGRRERARKKSARARTRPSRGTELFRSGPSGRLAMPHRRPSPKLLIRHTHPGESIGLDRGSNRSLQGGLLGVRDGPCSLRGYGNLGAGEGEGRGLSGPEGERQSGWEGGGEVR
jgi:hypothetical protein